MKDSYTTKVVLSMNGHLLPIGTILKLKHATINIGKNATAPCMFTVDSKRPSINGTHVCLDYRFFDSYLNLED